MTWSTVSSSCASDRNRHSNCDGGSSTPRRSIARWNTAKRSRSLVFASSSSQTSRSAKKSVSSDPTRWTRTAVPAPRADVFEPRVRGIVEQPQRGDARGHRERIARQRSRLIHRAERGDEAHERARAAVRADRQPAADHLSETGDVRPDARAALCSGRPDAEPGYDLVEDEERAG